MKLKMDLMTLENKITELINHSRSKYAKEEGYGIAVGLDILNSYLVDICKRAVDIDDPIIMCDFLNLGVLKMGNEEDAEAIRERAKAVKQ